MFNWNHFNSGDLQNWFNTPFFSPWQAMGNQSAFSPFGSNSAGSKNPFDFFEQYAKQWQGQPSFDWTQMTQNGLNPFFNSNELPDFVKIINDQLGSADESVVRDSLQSICDQWFMQAKQIVGLTEPAWLDSQRMFLQAMREGLSPQVAPPKHIEAMLDAWRNAISAQEACLQSMSDLTACFNDLRQEVSQKFMADIEKSNEITSINQLFSIWTNSFEACYSDVVLSGDFQKAFAQFVEDLSRLRLLFQQTIDEQVEKLGLPSHREMNTALRRLSEVRAQARELKKQVDTLQKKLDSARGADNYEDRLSALEKEIKNLKALSKPRPKHKATKKSTAKNTGARSKK